MISFSHKGDLSKTTEFLKRSSDLSFKNILSKYGQMGVDALKAATPRDTGLTADSWYYEIVEKKGITSINFCNSNSNDGVPIAIVIQYGHATRNGGYVQGTDYINPAIKKIFDGIADEAWREVTKS